MSSTKKPILEGCILEHSLTEKRVMACFLERGVYSYNFVWLSKLAHHVGRLLVWASSWDRTVTALLEFCAQDSCVPPLDLVCFAFLSLVACTLALIFQFLQQTSNRRASLVFLAWIFWSGSADGFHVSERQLSQPVLFPFVVSCILSSSYSSALGLKITSYVQ